jgi:histidinol-phosphate aminotransferase
MTIRIPEHIRGIAPYVPGKPIEETERQLGLRQVVKLASNENPLGPSPRAVKAIRETAGRVHRYPDGGAVDLRQALAERLDVPAAQIIPGNGSTELVEVLAKLFLGPGRGAVIARPAFIMCAIAVRVMGARVALVPLRQERHDLEAMAAACDESTALVYIGNPNNPTGTYVTRGEMDAYLKAVPSHVLTVVDEAYRDYVEAGDYPDGVAYVKAGAAIVALRTFSKIHGLAGLRIGYAVAPREVAAALETTRSPFNTSIPAQAAAVAALEDEEHVARSRLENARERDFLSEALRQRGIVFVPSVANFLLVQTGMRGEELFQNLLRQGVIVRPMENYGYPNGVRVSVGTRDENLKFLAALDAVPGARPPDPV